MAAPGRPLSQPLELTWRDWWRVVWRVMDEMDRRNLPLFAAGISFYTLLAIFPGIAALIALWGFVSDPGMIGSHISLAERLLPDTAFEVFNVQVHKLISANDSTLGLTTLISFALALWTARNGVASTIRGLNTIYRENHRPNPIKRYGMAIFLTLVLIIVGCIALAAILVMPAVLAFLPVPLILSTSIGVLKWGVVLAVVFFGIALLYRYGPNRRPPRLPWITPGAIFALIVWAVGSVAFSLFLRNFGNFNEVYGSIGAVVALLLWFYLSAFAVLLGAQINAEVELTTTVDTTRGSEKPSGARQAFAADFTIGANGEPVPTADAAEVRETG